MRLAPFDPYEIDAAVRAGRVRPDKPKRGAKTPIHKRWMSPLGPIRIMCEPIEGYVMARRPHCLPFVLAVSDLSGSTQHYLGPFEPVKPRARGRKR